MKTPNPSDDFTLEIIASFLLNLLVWPWPFAWVLHHVPVSCWYHSPLLLAISSLACLSWAIVTVRLWTIGRKDGDT